MDFASRKPFLRRLAIASTMVVVLTACGTAAFQHEESRLTFRVVRETPGWYTGMPDGVQEFDLPVAAGEAVEHIHAWWWPAPGGSPDAPAILYLHGARWSLTGQLFRIEELRDFGFSVLAIDYRGFGKSTRGMPSEDTAYEDARAAWAWLGAHHKDRARYVFGHSLGGAIAIDLASRVHDEQGVIVEDTFTSIPDVASASKWGWLPLRALITQRFDSLKKITQVHSPLLVVHGSDDTLVPSALGRKLYDAAKVRKEFLLVNGGTHFSTMARGEDQYREAIAQFFRLK
jgi:uncharacterized protein